MSAPRNLRAAMALSSFAVAAVAGWFTVREPAAEPSRVAAMVAGNARAPRDASMVSMPANKSPSATVAALERALALTLDATVESRFTGERLAELCAGDYPENLPGGNPAHSYGRRWAQQSPQQMFAWFQSKGRFTLPMRDSGSHFGFLNSLFHEWAKKDPGKALSAALQCASKRDRAGAVVTIIEALRKTDPVRAAAVAAEQLAVFAGQRIAGFSASGPTFKDTWDFLRALPPGKNRGAVLALYFDDLLRYHGKESAQIWKETPEEMRREIMAGGFPGTYLSNAEHLDGLAGLQRAHLEQTGDKNMARRFLESDGREWAERDPAAAIAWAQQHLKGEQRVEGTAQMFSAGAAKNFEATLELWQALPDGILRARAAGNLAAGAPAERKAEVDALVESLSAADRGIATAARRAAEAARRQREERERFQKSIREKAKG